MIDESTIAGRIKIGRNSVKMTQQELADKIGVSLITISRWENPDSGRCPNTLMLNKIADALGISAGYLFGVESDPANIEPYQLKNKINPGGEANTAVVTLKDGNRVEAPATPEGYAFLKEVFAMSLGDQLRTVATVGGKGAESQPVPWVVPLGREAAQPAAV